jgi:hypothetical protein
MIQYTDSGNAICPITLNSFRDIELPVAFLTAPHQPYECEELVIWLMERRVNPMTNLAVHWNHSLLEIIGPLRNCKVDRTIICAYIDSATARCDNSARASARRVFDWGFVSTFCFLLLLSYLHAHVHVCLRLRLRLRSRLLLRVRLRLRCHLHLHVHVLVFKHVLPLPVFPNLYHNISTCDMLCFKTVHMLFLL